MTDLAVNLDAARLLTAGPPSKESWSELGELLSWTPLQGTELQLALAEIDENLSVWPEDIRVADFGPIVRDLDSPVADGWDLDELEVDRWLPLVRRVAGSPQAIMDRLVAQSWHPWVHCVRWWDVTALKDIKSVSQTVERLPALSGIGFAGVIARHGSLPSRVRRDWQAFFQPSVMSLQRLDLSGMPVGPRGAKALVSSGHAFGLRKLHLRGAGLRSSGFRKLLLWPNDSPLLTLDVSDNRASSVAVGELLRSELMAGLGNLSIGGNEHDRSTAKSFSCLHNLSSIHTLNMDNSKIDVEWISELQQSNSLTALENLSISNNNIDDHMPAAISAGGFFRNITNLTLKSNKISASGAETLLETLGPWGQLRSIDLRGNRILRRDAHRLVKIAVEAGIEILV